MRSGSTPRPTRRKVAAAGEKAFVEAITIRDGDPAYDVAALAALPGVNDVADTLPLAPTRSFARPILGTVGPATAEIIEKSDGAVVAGDLAGLSGLAAAVRRAAARAAGPHDHRGAAPTAPRRGSCTRSSPRPARRCTTTLDVGLQEAAESVRRRRSRPASAVVAIRPSTGDVLAAASGAGGEGMSTATLGQFAPGSTFKVASALALLRSGLTADSDTSRARRRSRSTAGRSPTSPSTRRTSWAPSRCGPPSPTRATPPSSRPGTRRTRTRSSTPPGRSASTRTPRSGSPRSSGTSRATRTAPTTPRR